MTDDQINIAIAEACGWTDCEHVEALGLCKGKHENVLPQYFFGYSQLPDYCNDLNAIHDAEISLSGDGLECSLNEARYGEALFRVINPTKDGAGTRDFDKITATARQRAEAFLRTLGKWEESE
jgi:hypothetical protein